jgi:hypothetical protein
MDRRLRSGSPIAWLAAAGAACVVAFAAAGVRAEGARREVVVRVGGEAAVAQPAVVFELRDAAAGRRLAERPTDDLLGGLLAGVAPAAILDTGASGHVLSKATAARFGIASEAGARYVEIGMSGEHAMGVSRPYALALCEGTAASPGLGAPGGPPPARTTAGGRRAGARRAGGPRCEAALVLRAQRFLLNDAPDDPLALLASPGAAVDVIGMPAIREAVVEIRPDGVRLLPAGTRLPAGLWIRLAMVDFNRAHPRNRGPRPTVTVNPVVRGVRALAGGRETRGDWLLDTGSAVTLLSSAQAARLGLADGRGRPARAPDFVLPIGGIGGGERSLPGFRLERVEIEAEDGTVVVFPRAAVVVHDVVAARDGGSPAAIDGILGMSLLGGSGSGVRLGGFAREHASPFTRVVIDGPRARLGLTPRE